MRRLFLTEKPNVSLNIYDLLGEKGDYYMAIPCFVGYVFDYDIKKTNNMLDYYTPKYKLTEKANAFNFNVYSWGKESIKTEKNLLNEAYKEKIYNKKNQVRNECCLNKLKEFIMSFDEVIIATDYDRSGARGADLFFKFFLGGLVPKSTYRMSIFSLYSEHLKKSYKNKEKIDLKKDNSNSIRYINLLNLYKSKDFINYNFNIKIQTILKDFICDNKINKELDISISTLKTLILLNDKLTSRKDELFESMNYNGIGSVSSVEIIILNLFNLKLLKVIKTKKETKFQITKKGKELIELIDPSFSVFFDINLNDNSNTIEDNKKNIGYFHQEKKLTKTQQKKEKNKRREFILKFSPFVFLLSL